MQENRLLFQHKMRQILPNASVVTDELRRLAWGTDAGFYRLTPDTVLFPEKEQEVRAILKTANELEVPLTFRAAGTSLSGQAISDSVLVVAAHKWDGYRLIDGGEEIALQPGITGKRVNEVLKALGRRFSPDPASIDSAMIGGIIINNASGMNCGTHANSDKVMVSARMILADGTLLDTSDPDSRSSFETSHPHILKGIKQLRDEVLANKELKQRILYKYRIKNVTGLNLLPLLAFEDPFDIMAHLLVGSEGILAFLAEATLTTEVDMPCQASAMVYFTSIEEACRAVQGLKKGPVTAVELLDRKALRSVENRAGMPDSLKTLPEGATALLIETKAMEAEALKKQIAKLNRILTPFEKVAPYAFTAKAEAYKVWWAIRSGIFPSVGGMRPPGTTCLIEDVAFHLEDIPQATADLQTLLERHGYHDGVIYGHALEGNFHFILNQSFDSPEEVFRYEALMEDVVALVVDKYDGSLKAEHGTGRNMAPFVLREWGPQAFSVMKRIKELFDPKGILNPGVIFNDDPICHIKYFKPLPLIDPEVDKCIECGFCEINCLTAGFSLSSRQRIVLQREITRLSQSSEERERLQELKRLYRYWGNATCAGDGLCATSCPMEINTGHLTHHIREASNLKGSLGWKAGQAVANHFSGVKSALRLALTGASMVHSVIGDSGVRMVGGFVHSFGFPLWTPSLPKSYKKKKRKITTSDAESPAVVYFPSCINQTMGIEKKSPYKMPLVDKMEGLLHKAGYRVIYPKGMQKMCCGTIWESKGMPDIADRKTAELEAALWEASEQGRYPVLCDQSPCLYRMRDKIQSMKLYEPVEFIETFLVDRLQFHSVDTPIAIHTTCTMTKMGLAPLLLQLARRCATQVLAPEEVGCCGFAGDRGFSYPEINAYALRKLRPQLEAARIKTGYSNSRTCEIGLSTNGNIPYVSIVYLV
ncbi:MAG: FAD-binding oxidoreductase, partial [Bacteroidetes bacterium]|nr:FAD-binding oxidoreductase [Bacteroidota bacterium]